MLLVCNRVRRGFDGMFQPMVQGGLTSDFVRFEDDPAYADAGKRIG